MKHTLAALGDSQTDDQAGWGVDGFRTWVPVLADLLNRQGCKVRGRSFGISGDTTTQALARVDDLLFYDTPDLALIYAGVNDPGASITQAGTQANLQAQIKALKHGAKGSGLGTGVTVADQTALPATGELGQRYVVLSDASSTGGAAAWHTSQAATITGAGGSAQTVWEYRYPLTGEAGWGRVATASTAPTAVKRVAVVSTNYLNWTTGGDTTGTPYATYATVRAAQQAAVTAENVAVGGVASVIYVDLYGFQRARILAGTDPNFAGGTYVQATSWHVADSNQHHNAYGHLLVAQSVLAALPAAWVTALA